MRGAAFTNQLGDRLDYGAFVERASKIGFGVNFRTENHDVRIYRLPVVAENVQKNHAEAPPVIITGV